MSKVVAPALALLLFIGCLEGVGPAAAPEAGAAEKPLAVKDLNTPREFPKIESREEWQARATEIREQVLVSCGLWPMPEKTPLQAHIFGKIERERLQRREGLFPAAARLLPRGATCIARSGGARGRFPPFSIRTGTGKKAGLADNKDGSVAARCISFARQGMIAFSYDMVGYNDTFFPDDADVPRGQALPAAPPFRDEPGQPALEHQPDGASDLGQHPRAGFPGIPAGRGPETAGLHGRIGRRHADLSCSARWMIGSPRKRRW